MAANQPAVKTNGKAKPSAYILSIGNGNGETMSQLPAMAKDFSTGSRGYYATGKVYLDGVAYQVGCSIVEIGSKPKK